MIVSAANRKGTPFGFLYHVVPCGERIAMSLAKEEKAVPESNQETPQVIRVPAAAGGFKSKIQGGLDVWEYVLVARDYGWDEAAAARHLQQPVSHVRAALEEYRRDPAEVDARFRRMDEIAANPERHLPPSYRPLG
jgi:hypothetical protein